MAVTLEEVRAGAAPDRYPRDVLAGCETALVLFAAAFHGQQDAVWVAEAGLTATCVDVDAERLGEMEAVYPSDWDYVYGDAFAFAQATNRRWDIITIDCPSSLFARCRDLLPLWCSLAGRVVVLGCNRKPITVPEGWQETERRYRSSFLGGTYWAVIERC